MILDLPESPIISWAGNRIKKNKNCIVVVNGSTGSGKSFHCIKLAIDISTKMKTHFTLKDNMGFTFAELLRKSQLKQNQKPGTVFILEEIGAIGSGGASRNWQSKANQFFFSFMQTARHRNQILIFNCPMFSFLEKGARSLVHMVMTMKHIDYNKKISTSKPMLLQTNNMTGKVYTKYIRCTYQKRKLKIKSFETELPPQIMIEEYEKMKGKFTYKLNQMILAESEPKIKLQPKLTDEMVLYDTKLGLNTQQIALKHKCTERYVRMVVARNKNGIKTIKKVQYSLENPLLEEMKPIQPPFNSNLMAQS